MANAGGFLGATNPLNARLDAKSFVQLTIWILLILAAYGLAKMAYAKLTNAAQTAIGKKTATGETDLFSSG